MTTFCSACLEGPSGPAGHDAMMASSLGSRGLSLQCQSCGTFWERTRHPAGGFIWTSPNEGAAATPGMGIAIPPRSAGAAGPRLRRDPGFDRFVAAILGRHP